MRGIRRDVVVIGGGIIGACVALALLDDGARVIIVEPETPGDRHAASYGNGAFISPASIVPLSVPGLWRKVPGYLLDRTGPFTIQWRHLPALTPWLWRFLRAGATRERAAQTAGILAGLLEDAPRRHAVLAEAAGIGDLIRRDGLLYVYPDHAAFIQDSFAWSLRAEHGVAWREYEGNALQELEPSLHRRYQFGALVESGGHCTDPGAYVAGLVKHAVARGAELVKASVKDFLVDRGNLLAVQTDCGPIPCRAAIVAAGLQSRSLAVLLGDHVCLESERGYHIEIARPVDGPRIPVMPSDGKMANTMTTGGLRASGQVELARADAPPNWSRADILLQHLIETYPGLGPIEEHAISRWFGNRPSTPDGLPCLSYAAATRDVVYAFGHGHIGLAASAKTGEIVAAMIAGKALPPVMEALAASRFHYGR